MSTFEEIGVAPELLKGIEELGFQHPTPIQEKVIPPLLEGGEDLIGLSQTGTGKTCAFGLPVIQLADLSDVKTQALILVPTRELCQQIVGDLKLFAKYLPALQIVAIYGGANMERQITALKKGAQIIVATPGRMNDLLNKQNRIDLSATRTVVLDEADEMLNMGFKEELDAILEKTPDSKNTLLFSATMPAEVLRISRNYMNKPRRITVGVQDSGAENVKHICFVARSKDRYLALKRIVDYYPDVYAIIFCRTRLETKEVAQKLVRDGYNADALHGDLSQAQREYIMRKFRVKSLQLLVATDVAARGLDVKDISHIINYNLPDEAVSYTHRSGRTGRAGRKGTSIAILNLREKYKIKKIEAKLKKKFEVTLIPGGTEICEKQLIHLIDRMEKIEVNHKEIDKFLPVAYEKLEWLSREELIKYFVSLEFNRFLDYYKDAEDLNQPEEGDKKGKRRKNGRSDRNGENYGAGEGFVRFRVNLGYKDSLAPRDMIGLINRVTRRKDINIGKIDLMKTSSFFEVEEKRVADILAGFEGIEYNRRDVFVKIVDDSEFPWREAQRRKKQKKAKRKSRKKNEK